MFLGRPERSAFLARELRARGFEVTHYNTEGFNGDPWVPVRRGFVPALARLLLRSNHDVYFTGLSFLPSFSLYLNRVLRGKPYVFNATGILWEVFRDRSRGRMFRRTVEHRIYPLLLDRVFAGASRIACNSRFLCTAISTSFPQYRNRLTTIYNGVDFDRYASGRRIEIPGIEPSDFVLLFVTSLNYHNKSRGLDLALDAFGRVRARVRSAKLVIAAKSSSPHYRRGAEEAVATCASRDGIVLLFNSDSVPDLLASSHLFVFATPENSESLPRALLEAQAAGRAAVATGTVGCGEIVRDGETGRVVGYDADEMADAILELMDSPALLRAMGGQAAEHVRETFSWGGMADRYADVFVDVGRRPAAGVPPSSAAP
jgi:glycosyltransferase involved in cell wall biosynthesis